MRILETEMSRWRTCAISRPRASRTSKNHTKQISNIDRSRIVEGTYHAVGARTIPSGTIRKKHDTDQLIDYRQIAGVKVWTVLTSVPAVVKAAMPMATPAQIALTTVVA